MFTINRFHIKGFRRLLDVNLEMRPIQVMIGANSIGKTSLLDALSLLSASAEGKLNQKINEFGGLNSLLTLDRAQELAMNLEIENQQSEGESSKINYEICLTLKGQSYVVSYDKMIKYNKHSPNRSLLIGFEDKNSLESLLSQQSNDVPITSDVRKFLISLFRYQVFNIEPRSPIRLPQQMKPALQPGHIGEDLIPYLYFLRESHPDRYESVLDSLRAAFPTFEDFRFPPVAAGMLALTWKDKNFSNPLYMHQLSEGTLRFLWLVSLLQSPELSAITTIDEPEVSLHPELLSLLADLMREASQRTQLIVATHSDRLIRFLKPEEVLVFDSDEEGNTQATWADQMDLEKWLQEYSLDEIWQMGQMGGRA